METHVIAVMGSSPGVGKSTLCSALARWIAESGAVVDHFEEADVLTRAAFHAVAEEFAEGRGSVRPQTLVDATRSYVRQARADCVDVMVTDALIPFIPSLVAWGHDETAIAGFVRELEAAVEPAQVTVVYLRDAPETALRRAVEREGPQWADWYVDKLSRSPGTRSVADLASAAGHLRHAMEMTLRLRAATHWTVMIVDVTDRDAAQTGKHVRDRLHDRLGNGAY